MIRKLRKKFIGISMGSLVLVLVLLIGLINGLNYREMVKRADNMLEFLGENGGTFPEPREGQSGDPKLRALLRRGRAEAATSDQKEESGQTEAAQEEAGRTAQEEETGQAEEVQTGHAEAAASDQEEESGQAEAAQEKTGQTEAQSSGEDPERAPRRPSGMTPETPYETRFFLARQDGEGKVLSVDTGRIAAVDEETAAACVRQAWEKGSAQGFVGPYRYLRQESDGGYLVIFLDCNRERNACQSFLLISVGVAVFGILLVFALIFVLSGFVMRPVYESYEKQKRFITDAGHEIRTPLTIIDADIDVLGMEIGENEWLEDMQRQTERLCGLTNELIYLARMEEGDNQMQRIELPFSDIVEETAASFQAVAIVEQKCFEVRIQPMLVVCGDEKALRKLVSILLDNAVKYSGEEGRISVRLERTGRTVRLTVWNTARELSKESISHLFDRFYRADTARNSLGGYGIGLSVAEAIVRSHRGEIRAFSEDGCSLTILVSLPAAAGVGREDRE